MEDGRRKVMTMEDIGIKKIKFGRKMKIVGVRKKGRSETKVEDVNEGGRKVSGKTKILKLKKDK
jgi:hypothetical protein